MELLTTKFNPVKSPSLYSMTGDLMDALAAVELDPETGEITGMDRVDALTMDTEEKLVSVACAIKRFSAMTDEIDKEIKALKQRRDFMAKLTDKMQANALQAMRVLGVKKITSAPAVLSVCAKAPAVEITDDAKLPDEFVKVKTITAIDKIGISRALKAGREVPGARMITGDFYLKVR